MRCVASRGRSKQRPYKSKNATKLRGGAKSCVKADAYTWTGPDGERLQELRLLQQTPHMAACVAGGRVDPNEALRRQ